MARPIRKPTKKAFLGGTENEAVEKGIPARGISEDIEKRLEDLLEALEAVRKGDLTRKLKQERCCQLSPGSQYPDWKIRR